MIKLVNSCGRLGLDEDRPERIEEELQEDPCMDFGEHVGGPMCFGLGGDVDVHAINALAAVVFEVILLECDGHGDTDGDVGEDS